MPSCCTVKAKALILPDIFALSDKECRELDAKKNLNKPAEQPAEPAAAVPPMPGSPVPPPMPGAAVPPPPMPTADPVVQMFLFIGGAQYGPYDYATCRQFTKTGQLTAETMVWEQGMAAWTPAGQVEKLKGLFGSGNAYATSYAPYGWSHSSSNASVDVKNMFNVIKNIK